MKEEWKDIEDYEGKYQVSNKGRVRSLARTYTDSKGVVRKVKQKVLSQVKDPVGYMKVSFAGRCIKVHRLVAKAFVPNPDNKEIVNHINEKKHFNYATNLEWLTLSENSNHGTAQERKGKNMSKSRGKPILRICPHSGDTVTYNNASEACRNNIVSATGLNRCLQGIQKVSAGYIWKYGRKRIKKV